MTSHKRKAYLLQINWNILSVLVQYFEPNLLRCDCVAECSIYLAAAMLKPNDNVYLSSKSFKCPPGIAWPGIKENHSYCKLIGIFKCPCSVTVLGMHGLLSDSHWIMLMVNYLLKVLNIPSVLIPNHARKSYRLKIYWNTLSILTWLSNIYWQAWLCCRMQHLLNSFF